VSAADVTAAAGAQAGAAALPVYRATLEAKWIDYNGHLRDAYYGLVQSYAIDDVMDHLGLDAEYRERTRCTLYTLELHTHYLHEVKGTDGLRLTSSILDADGKRIHLGCRFEVDQRDGRPLDAEGGALTVATSEAMLLHVHQGDRPATAPFPAAIAARIDALKLTLEDAAAWGPRSRKLELKRRPAQ
jgi:acyl-CoA thioester hydrolase